ncbi:Aflatoxin biosynthesis regulatory protein [Penicillium coprophilum]|uniref:Aflatoxin biosynthesis regulatory protein n=1 Tax=Penicillium coprophilum TaxID=36646 RepID=UPI0023922C55|nr:Aflatoxin biosynthesis regulatory protein [Penicillium coprophilum]KAJ5177738.1 Aflatoxin biosynthesis regulatory protein [Penicillium coprophilum]
MARDSIRITRPEKLRSSCDRCGTAKVKCDKEQPECGRCISHGVPCIYGVSRKMGKPPRRISLCQSTSDTATTTQSSSETSSGGMPLDLELSSTDMNTWDHMDEDNNSHTFKDILDAGRSFDHELPIPMIPNLPMDYNEWAISDQANANILFPLRSSQQSSTQGEDLSSMTFQWQWDGHDCQQKSHGILESISAYNIHKSESEEGLPPPTALAPRTETTVNGVPLDLVLQLNREATERLIQLVSCPCARIPSVALLYASIISRVLAWYEQAAACTQMNSLPLSSKAAGHNLTPSNSSRGTSSPPLQPPEVSVAPSQMMVGTFNVDDPLIQTMMNIHLISGEMKRVEDVIDQFGSQTGCSTPGTEQIGGLFLTLNSWLKQDYSRILHMMQSELKKLTI